MHLWYDVVHTSTSQNCLQGHASWANIDHFVEVSKFVQKFLAIKQDLDKDFYIKTLPDKYIQSRLGTELEHQGYTKIDHDIS